MTTPANAHALTEVLLSLKTADRDRALLLAQLAIDATNSGALTPDIRAVVTLTPLTQMRRLKTYLSAVVAALPATPVVDEINALLSLTAADSKLQPEHTETAADVAQRWGVTPEYVRYLAQSEKLPHLRAGLIGWKTPTGQRVKYLFDPAEVDEFFAPRRVEVEKP